MKKKPTTIQSNLFFTYSLIIIVVSAIFVTSFYFYVADLLRKNNFAAIEDLCASLSKKLDLEIQKMDNVSLNVAYSNLIKNYFHDYLSNDAFNKFNARKISNAEKIVDIMVAISGPSLPPLQLNLYDFNGWVIGSHTKLQKVDVRKKFWYSAVSAKKGKKYITKPFLDKNLVKRDKHFISLCRVYFDNFFTPQGIIEIKQDCDYIFGSFNELLDKQPKNKSIYICNDSGELIYPNTGVSLSNFQYYYQLIKKHPSKNSLRIKNPISREKELLSFSSSDFTGWTVIILTPEAKLLAPVFVFTNITVWGVVIILVFALLLSFGAAKKITIPIAKLHQAIKSFNWEKNSTNPEELNSGLNEIEELNLAFQKMNCQLKKSIEERILSEQHEMHALMLAFQSQMNPHFLYNTLTTISVLAEEQMHEMVVKMCKDVSYMLRYISSHKSPLVKMKLEFDYTEKYLECMKFRHRDCLRYSIERDPDLDNVEIPKLIIQPLVENAIKYGACDEPSWDIKVKSFKGENHHWQVRVTDNGPGFTREEISLLFQKMNEIDQTLRPGLDLDGMGLLNIYIRLKLTYGDLMIFKVENHPKGGAMITIGGSLVEL
ncbi:MAG TPA: histidine kinase [Bacillota bacterium]|nr:histidine kinase [Bacillota bacterium]